MLLWLLAGILCRMKSIKTWVCMEYLKCVSSDASFLDSWVWSNVNCKFFTLFESKSRKLISVCRQVYTFSIWPFIYFLESIIKIGSTYPIFIINTILVEKWQLENFKENWEKCWVFVGKVPEVVARPIPYSHYILCLWMHIIARS